MTVMLMHKPPQPVPHSQTAPHSSGPYLYQILRQGPARIAAQEADDDDNARAHNAHQTVK